MNNDEKTKALNKALKQLAKVFGGDVVACKLVKDGTPNKPKIKTICFDDPVNGPKPYQKPLINFINAGLSKTEQLKDCNKRIENQRKELRRLNEINKRASAEIGELAAKNKRLGSGFNFVKNDEYPLFKWKMAAKLNSKTNTMRFMFVDENEIDVSFCLSKEDILAVADCIIQGLYSKETNHQVSISVPVLNYLADHQIVRQEIDRELVEG